ncbi:MAG: hypothetical protein IPK82_36250 [Polyangiaceae bacterium]|nr:hypothetical protein [Polyangiaceae bacterium]
MTWQFEGFAGEQVFVLMAGQTLDANVVKLPPVLAERYLRAWLLHPVDRRKVVDLHKQITFREHWAAWEDGQTHQWMIEELVEAFDRGSLVLFSPAELTAPQLLDRPGPSRPQVQVQNKRTWIEVELLDPDGRRVAADLLITLPNGTKLRPAFSGFLRLDDIDPGTCDIEFPQIDGREWDPKM